jgi:tetratricopeptide (TPR) repeat protein
MERRLLAALVFVATIVFYAATLPRGVLPGDSGELIAASHTLSIAHPPGYPLYIMIGKIFSSALNWGSIAYRFNLLSAVISSAALMLLYLTLVELGVGRILGLGVAAGLGTLESFWLQATMAEVYAMNAFFTILLLYCSLLGRRYGERAYVLLAYTGGLALSHHLSLVYPLVCALGILVFSLRVVPRVRTIMISVLLLIVGLSAWLYIPIRATHGPPLVWGKTDTLSGFWAHITAQGYRWRLRELALAARVSDFLRFFAVAARQSGLALLVAAAVGIVANIRRRASMPGFLALVLLFAFHFAMYNIPDIESHTFPALIGIAVLAALGIQGVINRLAGLRSRIGLVIATCTFLLPALNLFEFNLRSDEWFGHDYGRAIIQSAREACGEDCIIVTSGDISTFPLLYASLVEPGGTRVYDLAASNPAVIGASERPAGLEACAAAAAGMFGRSNVALLGPLPRYLLGSKPRICGMINVIDEPEHSCKPPSEYAIRGVAADLREYSSRLLTGSYYLHLARWYVQQGDVAGSRANVRSALDAAGDDVGTHINAATLLLDAGMPREAMDVAATAVNVDPDFFEAHDLLGNLLAAAGRTDEAIAEYSKALKGNPSPAMVYSNLANAYAARGDHPAAIENFIRAIALDSTLVNAHIGMGRSLDATGKTPEAILQFRRAYGIDPGAVSAYHAEASLHLRLGDCEGAIEAAQRGLRRLPENPVLLADIGVCRLRQDDLDGAIDYLQRALAGDPTMITARGNLAVALERKGLDREAAREYRKYIDMAPPGTLKLRAQEALERLTGGGEAGP